MRSDCCWNCLDNPLIWASGLPLGMVSHSKGASGCRAKAAALRVGGAGDGSGVSAGSYVEIHIINVATDKAEHVLSSIELGTKVELLCDWTQYPSYCLSADVGALQANSLIGLDLTQKCGTLCVPSGKLSICVRQRCLFTSKWQTRQVPSAWACLNFQCL